MKNKPSASFTVAFGNVTLTKAQKAAMQRAIEGAALGELARLDLARKVDVRYPKEWIGIWLDRLRSDPMPWKPDVQRPGVPRGG